MKHKVQITISETSGRYVFDDSGDMKFELNDKALQPTIEKVALIDEDKIHEAHNLLSEIFPTCHVNFVWGEQPTRSFIAGASNWAMEVEY